MRLTEGTRVVLTRAVERFPFFIARAGMAGTVIEATEDLVSVRMDEHLPGAEEWSNEIVWMPEDEPGLQRSAIRAAKLDLETEYHAEARAMFGANHEIHKTKEDG